MKHRRLRLMNYSIIEGVIRQTLNIPIKQQNEKAEKTSKKRNRKHLEQHNRRRQSGKLELERECIRDLRRDS